MFTTLSSAMHKMIRAHANIANRHVLFKGTLDSLQLEETNKEGCIKNGHPIPTMATDGWKTYFNTDFTNSLSETPRGELEAVCLHEHLHRVFNHPLRGWKISQLEGEEYNQLVMNLAADFAINPIITDMGYELPPGCCMDEKFRGMTMEAIYRQLMKSIPKSNQKDWDKMTGGNKPNKGKGQDQSGKGTGPDVMAPQTQAQASALEEAAKRMKHKMEKSRDESDKSQIGSQAGYCPDSLAKAFDEIIPVEKADWREILRDPLQTHKSYRESTWARPNRRYIGTGITLPGYAPDQISRIVMCVDTSGSMCSVIGEMKHEIMRLMDQCLVNEVVIYSVDDRIRSKSVAKTSAEIENFTMMGGGGTHFRECMREVAKENAVACVFLTDLQTGDFGDEPPFPVIWVDWTNGGIKAPFGTTLRYHR